MKGIMRPVHQHDARTSSPVYRGKKVLRAQLQTKSCVDLFRIPGRLRLFEWQRQPGLAVRHGDEFGQREFEVVRFGVGHGVRLGLGVRFYDTDVRRVWLELDERQRISFELELDGRGR